MYEIFLWGVPSMLRQAQQPQAQGTRFSLLGQAKRAELERDKLRDRGGVALRQAQGPQALGGWDLLDGHKKETRGVEPRVSDHYYCSAGLSVSIGQ